MISFEIMNLVLSDRISNWIPESNLFSAFWALSQSICWSRMVDHLTRNWMVLGTLTPRVQFGVLE